MNKKLAGVVVALVVICCLNHQSVYAQSNIYKLHALFLYNFTKHVQWNDLGDNFTIGVFGSEKALKEIKANFSGKKVSGKEIKVINVGGIGDANGSQLVYMPKSNKTKS